MRTPTRWLVTLILLLLSAPAVAVIGVSPFGVNVRSTGPTSVYLTFQSLDPGEGPVDAYWCGELQPGVLAGNELLQFPIPVQTSDPCVRGTIYGQLPSSLDRSRPSTSGSFTNLTDIMTIPPSVARRAYQAAQAGANSAFFYVRRFSGPSGDRYVVVTCRMGGGGARTALALLDVRVGFEGRRDTVLPVAREDTPPRAAARILYNGAGTLRGRWEVMQPGDPEPSDTDLLTEATLPPEQRSSQRRYLVVGRFEVFLPPTGEYILPGPEPARVPTQAEGPYKLLLRIESTDDRESLSDTGGGRLTFAGGVAGFPMPVLRYYVGAAETLAAMGREGAVAPAPGAELEGALEFAWVDVPGALWVRLEVRAAEAEVLAAVVPAGVGRYAAPPWFVEAQRGKPLSWRVVAHQGGGRALAGTSWRTVTVR